MIVVVVSVAAPDMVHAARPHPVHENLGVWVASPEEAPAAVASAVSVVERQTRECLGSALMLLARADGPPHVLDGLRALMAQVGEPAVVAVVGQVNSGKSTFINALLREDKAPVGNTETTATISHFVYGEPDPVRPVRCHWVDGSLTQETVDFLAQLQGHDLEALRRADRIDRLEHVLRNELLRALTLVDTPGTSSVVVEHEERTTAFLEVAEGMRRRHDTETVRIRKTADAVIYLVGAIARQRDSDLLADFTHVSGGDARAMNAIGVLAKVDIADELVERRDELARHVARQLESTLNAVVPVSAALARTLDRLAAEEPVVLEELSRISRSISAEQVDVLLSNEELYETYEPAGCSVTAEERRALRLAIPCEWRVFTLLVIEARRGGDGCAVLARLRDIAGFDRLRKVVMEQFVLRAGVLRCYRVLQDARSLLRQEWFVIGPKVRKAARFQRDRLQRFLAYLDDVGGVDEVGFEVRAFIRATLAPSRVEADLQVAWASAEETLSRALHLLEEMNADWWGLRELIAAPQDFTTAEADELRSLLGMYGTDLGSRLSGEPDVDRCIDRQLAWRLVRDQSPQRSVRRRLADRAHARLGLIIDEMMRESAAAPS